MKDFDVTIVVAIVVVLLVVLAVVWPGYIRVRNEDFEGHWQSAAGTRPMYEIRPIPDNPDEFEIAGDNGSRATGRAVGVRGVRARDPATGATIARGSLEFGRRRINWEDGDIWVRQGI